MDPREMHFGQFEELGRDSVRRAVLLGRWKPEKLSHARQWLEQQDAREWLVGRQGEAPRQRRAWVRKLCGYGAAGFGLLFMTLRLFRLLRYGA